VNERVYWPVYSPGTNDTPTFLCFFDDEAMAKAMAEMFKVIKVQAAVHPPVRLSIFNTFLQALA
jgi:hypothetical protein